MQIPTKICLFYQKKHNWVLDLSPKSVYITLAIAIRIIGKQNKPLENNKMKRPLRTACKEAIDNFKTLYPSDFSVGLNQVEKLIGLPLLTHRLCPQISHKFQLLVHNVGESCCGDEKLFHFTGNSSDIRQVLTKPDRIGLWFYQLCAPLNCGKSFLLHVRLHQSHELEGISVPVADVVENWANVVKQVGNPKTLLTMDSYYLTEAGRTFLRQMDIKFIAAITKERFSHFYKVLKPQWT